eukprot:144625_1
MEPMLALFTVVIGVMICWIYTKMGTAVSGNVLIKCKGCKKGYWQMYHWWGSECKKVGWCQRCYNGGNNIICKSNGNAVGMLCKNCDYQYNIVTNTEWKNRKEYEAGYCYDCYRQNGVHSILTARYQNAWCDKCNSKHAKWNMIDPRKRDKNGRENLFSWYSAYKCTRCGTIKDIDYIWRHRTTS